MARHELRNEHGAKVVVSQSRAGRVTVTVGGVRVPAAYSNRSAETEAEGLRREYAERRETRERLRAAGWSEVEIERGWKGRV